MTSRKYTGAAIFLVGARAVGKTTVGQSVARKLKADFVDTDIYMGEIHQLTVAEIVAKEGWEGFRRHESAALKEVARPGRVIATGGGMVLAGHNRTFMREHGLVFYLSAPAEVLGCRLSADPKAAQRPSLTGKSVVEEMTQILMEREEFYQSAAHHVVDASGRLEDAVDFILAKASGREI
ncbi:shikimate kinase AroL [Deltaproteobacteria bacterium Smac51]|nr:shikimate kinase AroL [Deltaproteobacteria bacterium Smac51]